MYVWTVGVLDFYFFVNSYASPDDIVQLYQEVIGRPAMPPYWALGFHQCRYGYKNLEEVKDVVKNFSSNKVRMHLFIAIIVDVNIFCCYLDSIGYSMDRH